LILNKDLLINRWRNKDLKKYVKNMAPFN
jgi:hypothetical protein